MIVHHGHQEASGSSRATGGLIYHRRGAFGVAHSDNLGNARAFESWNRATDLAPRSVFSVLQNNEASCRGRDEKKEKKQFSWVTLPRDGALSVAEEQFPTNH